MLMPAVSDSPEPLPAKAASRRPAAPLVRTAFAAVFRICAPPRSLGPASRVARKSLMRDGCAAFTLECAMGCPGTRGVRPASSRRDGLSAGREREFTSRPSRLGKADRDRLLG